MTRQLTCNKNGRKIGTSQPSETTQTPSAPVLCCCSLRASIVNEFSFLIGAGVGTLAAVEHADGRCKRVAYGPGTYARLGKFGQVLLHQAEWRANGIACASRVKNLKTAPIPEFDTRGHFDITSDITSGVCLTVCP